MALAMTSRITGQKACVRSFGKKASVAKAARNVRVMASAADRQLWYPGNEPPAWLDGSLAGDFGFDPLGLGSEPEKLRWNVEAELIHCRWAMLGVAGILLPGIATKAGALNVPAWYDAGKVYIESSDIPFGTLLVVQFILFGWVETKRWYHWLAPGSQADGSFFGITDAFKGKENGYPGGRFFDFFGMANGPKYPEYKEKELKNGRLAMVAMLGFWSQYAATGKDPIDNLVDHLADPFHVTFATNGVSVPFLK